MHGFHHRGEFDPPEWANNLKNYYWYIRVEGRDKAKRRRFYRLIEKEKLRLAEIGVNQELILVVCKYLSNLKKSYGMKMHHLQSTKTIQMMLDFKIHS
jgi:hypothetical protein